MDAFWPPFSPSPHSSLDTFSQAKVLSVPGKRELTVPAREAPPTVETCFMELRLCISWGLISRIGVISPEARVAAQRREVAGRLERELREERQAQWMASLRGPGWARRGRCHGF